MNRNLVYSWSFLILVVITQSVSGQNIPKDRLYKLPAEFRLAFAVVQKTSPVQFTNIDVLVTKKGGTPSISWSLKNNSSKTVRRFQVAFKIRTIVDELTGTGGQIFYDIGTDSANDLILAHGSYTEFANPESALPTEIRNWFDPEDKAMESGFVLVYGMIQKVVFSDGTIYSGDSEIFQRF